MGKKVLFTASTYSHIRHFHLPYLRRFQEEGWVVHVACGDARVQVPYADETIPLPFVKKMGALSNFKAVALLRKKIRQEKYDLITTHTSLAAFFTRLAVMGVKQRPQVVNMVHGYLFDSNTAFLKKQILLMAERVTAPATDLLLTMNRWDLETAQKYRLGKRIVHMPGIGVDTSHLHRPEGEHCRALRGELGLAEGDFALIYAAEFSSRKSQSVLIHAMTELPQYVKLILPGDGALREECMMLTRTLQVEERVLFPGYVTNMALWYAMADAAISASRSEGLPFNIMEAMVMGLPVVASAVKGHTDLIIHGETGLLYPYGDSTACARAVIQLLEDPDQAKVMAKESCCSIEQYSLARVLPMVMEQYESMVRKETGILS